MGCGISRTESGDEIPSALLPFLRRIHDLKRTKTDLSPRRPPRDRKDSIVSTAELLRPEERDIDYYDTAAMEASADKDDTNAKTNQTNADDYEYEYEDEEKEKERKIGFRRNLSPPPEEDFPGSPSFRFYFTDAVDDGGSAQAQKADALKRIEEKDLLEEKEGRNESLVAAEGSDFKVIKKEKGRKFMTLPKANFLNVRGCYNKNSSSLEDQEGTRILSEKAT